MPLYRGKTTHELLVMLEAMSLETILRVNHSYGPYFINLEESIDNAQAGINNCQQRLIPLVTEYDALEKKIADEAVKRKEALSNMPGNRAERLLQLNYLTQPSYWESKQAGISEQIGVIKSELRGYEKTLRFLAQDKTETVAELEKVIFFLDKKRKEEADKQAQLEAADSVLPQ